MKKLKRYSKPIQEAWSVYQIMRTLGFPSDDIFWEYTNTLNVEGGPGMALNIVLRTQGKTFTVTCSGALSGQQALAMDAESREFQVALGANKFSNNELTKVLHASHAWTHKPDLLLAIAKKGISFPLNKN